MHCLICKQPFLEKISWQFVYALTTPAMICELCSEKLTEIQGEICRKCGRPFAHLDPQFRSGDRCADCIRWQSDALEKNRSLYVYNDFLQEVIATWKYRGDAELVKLFWQPLQKAAKQFPVDVAVPIPLDETRLYERSFNQAKLLAEGLPFEVVEVLQRPQESRKQSKKTRKERLQEEDKEEKFQIVPALLHTIQDKKVLLVDDIYTTGATLYEAAAVLKANQAAHVYALTVARG
ncbi:ComF family protein [Bacillaceae bacterium IKA-2]|nr:ComF family protein [Bacillaceae bacterium IKA-2]